MNTVLPFALLLAVGAAVSYFTFRRLVGWLFQVLATGARESNLYGVENKTAGIAFFRVLVLSYVCLGWVAFCVAVTHRFAAGAEGWLYWLYFATAFIAFYLISGRGLRDLGDHETAFFAARSPGDIDMIFAAGVNISFFLGWGMVAAFIVFSIWPQLIAIPYFWVRWLMGGI